MIVSSGKVWLIAFMTQEPLQPQDKYVLRLPDGMRERLKTKALENNRSLNAEIIGRLEESLRKDGLPAITPEIFDKLFSRLDKIDEHIKKSK